MLRNVGFYVKAKHNILYLTICFSKVVFTLKSVYFLPILMNMKREKNEQLLEMKIKQNNQCETKCAFDALRITFNH